MAVAAERPMATGAGACDARRLQGPRRNCPELSDCPPERRFVGVLRLQNSLSRLTNAKYSRAAPVPQDCNSGVTAALAPAPLGHKIVIRLANKAPMTIGGP